MSRARLIHFEGFRYDRDGERLWRGDEEVPLTARTSAMLGFLLSHPGQLVSKEELLDRVWLDTRISPDTLRSTLRELRRALSDDGRAPRFVETVHGRGYRFIAEVEQAEGLEPTLSRPGPRTASQAALVGRDEDLDRLRSALDVARSGRRQVLFVSGEPGIGKTTLTQAFLGEAATDAGVRVTHGQCTHGPGAFDSYLTILEALQRLCEQPGGDRAVELLERFAPTWLVEMPGLLKPADLQRVRASVIRVDRDRMLLELSRALEALSAEWPLVILLEDLHWSDAATLNAIDVLARRTEPARLMIIGTHRPVAASGARKDLAQLVSLRAELALHDLCTDLPLQLLSEQEVGDYLGTRLDDFDVPAHLSRFVYSRSEGNPLIMVSQVSEMVRNGSLERSPEGWRLARDYARQEMPLGVRQMVEFQLGQLTREDQHVLETASVAGLAFSATSLAAFDADQADFDAALLRVAREHGIVEVDGANRNFVHSIYQEFLYDRLSAPRRERLHLALGSHLEALHAGDASPIAAALAMHFERGGDFERAVMYLERTGEQSMQRSEHEAAIEQFRHALSLLRRLENDENRTQRECSLLARLGRALSLTVGYVDAEVHRVYERAAELSGELHAFAPEAQTVLNGLHSYYELRGDHAEAIRIATQQVEFAGATGDALDRVVATLCLSISNLSIGQPQRAGQLVETCIEAYDPTLHGPSMQAVVTDHGVNALGCGSLVFGALGQLGRALEWEARAIELARHHEHLPSEVHASYYAMTLRQLFRDVDGAKAAADHCLSMSIEKGFPFFVPATLIVQGWIAAQQGDAAAGAQQASQGIALLEGAGAQMGMPLWQAMLAETHALNGDVEAGLAAVAAGLAIAASSGERGSEPALHQVHGDLLLARPGTEAAHQRREAEAAYGKGIAVASAIGAPTQGLGAAVGLARLAQTAKQRRHARAELDRLLADIDGQDVPLVTEAHAALAE